MIDVDYTVGETATRLKLSPATIRRLIHDCELTAFRSGKRKWLIPDESIGQYRARQTVQAKPIGVMGTSPGGATLNKKQAPKKKRK